MFWNGSGWVDDRSAAHASPARQRRGRIRDLLATLPIVLLVPVFMIPILAVQASSAELTVAGATVPGGRIAVSGEGMPQREWIQIQWDGSSDGMATVRTTSDSRFSTSVTIPSAARADTTTVTTTPTSTPTPIPIPTPTPTPSATPRKRSKHRASWHLDGRDARPSNRGSKAEVPSLSLTCIGGILAAPACDLEIEICVALLLAWALISLRNLKRKGIGIKLDVRFTSARQARRRHGRRTK